MRLVPPRRHTKTFESLRGRNLSPTHKEKTQTEEPAEVQITESVELTIEPGEVNIERIE